MKIVLYTQRVEIIESYGERRDCADQNIPRFIKECGYLPVPVPNVWEVAVRMAEQLRPAGMMLTGGNSLVRYGGDAPERDDLEKRLLEYALEREIPVYGFCRGMQVILDYFGCILEEVKGHVAVRHKVSGAIGEQVVNSFHNQACFHLQLPLEALAWADDGVVEAVCCDKKHLLGTMWHPERVEPFAEDDIRRVQQLFH
ncbi:Gamma-glutamyl-CDP-amidate hydrolase [Eubacterium plexicaudatum ASF492]|uniref:Uncharacterized protein n=1 Tax=Eubacterium plexicaudatum ASF492 TaxID=1235802 RepID=N2AXC6_9FIRM|nr:Gamma-glutamyl-CDP-amidate hydrolase [Eubacterium plexicaudatum ASF492]